MMVGCGTLQGTRRGEEKAREKESARVYRKTSFRRGTGGATRTLDGSHKKCVAVVALINVCVVMHAQMCRLRLKAVLSATAMPT